MKRGEGFLQYTTECGKNNNSGGSKDMDQEIQGTLSELNSRLEGKFPISYIWPEPKNLTFWRRTPVL